MKLWIVFFLLWAGSLVKAQEPVPCDTLAADFRQFIRYLEETHPDPYSAFGGKVFFHKKAGETEREILARNYSVPEFRALLNRFVAPLGDGHTLVNIPRKENQETFLFFPFKGKVIAEGIVLSAVPEEQKEYLGSKLLSIDGIPVEKLTQKAGETVPCENLYGMYAYLSRGMETLNILQKLLPAGETITLRLRTPQGEEKSWKVKAAPRKKLDSLLKSTCPAWEITHKTGNMEWRFLDKKQETAYFRLHSVMAYEAYAFMQQNGWNKWKEQVMNYHKNFFPEKMPADTLKALAAIPVLAEKFRQMLEAMKKAGTKHLIIDLRGNGGGFTPITLPTIYMLYGDRYLQTDMGIAFYRLLSPLYLQKNNSKLADFNRNRERPLQYGDYIEDAEPAKDLSSEEIRQKFLQQCIGGGDTYIRDLEGRPVYTPARVFVVTDENTFSAAFHYAFYLWKMGATLVGIPSRQSPNTFMEVTPFRLPRTGTQGSISNSAQYFLPPTDHRARIFWPDWTLSYEDYKKYNFDSETEIRYLIDKIQQENFSGPPSREPVTERNK